MRSIHDLAAHLERLPISGPAKIVAIDGCGGAGKSTLAASLCQAWKGSAIVHTDDFASWEQPTEWWPRLRSEVLLPLSKGEAATFQKYDWVERRLREWETIATNRVILEGVSSSRNEFRPYLSYCVWVETDRDERLKRGLERDGEDALGLWQGWMEAEDAYMAAQNPKERADLVLDGEDAFRFIGT